MIGMNNIDIKKNGKMNIVWSEHLSSLASTRFGRSEHGISVRRHDHTATPPMDMIRQEVKRILLAETELTTQDFYQQNRLDYLPRKLALKRLVDFHQTFATEAIARFIALAHREDESFLPLAKQCMTALTTTETEFAGLIILASGSGQLVTYLCQALPDALKGRFNYQLYGVDVSDTMSAQSAALLSCAEGSLPAQVKYQPVTADCTRFENMARQIRSLQEKRPFLVVSHGGLRYFAPGYIHRFLQSMSEFPAGSTILLSEAGIEMRPLMHEIMQTAITMPTLATTGVDREP